MFSNSSISSKATSGMRMFARGRIGAFNVFLLRGDSNDDVESETLECIPPIAPKNNRTPPPMTTTTTEQQQQLNKKEEAIFVIFGWPVFL
jgi:hypothetical protein